MPTFPSHEPTRLAHRDQSREGGCGARRTRGRFSATIGVLAVIALSAARAHGRASARSSVDAVPNPRLRGSWVSDVAQILPAVDEAAINSMLDDLERQSTVEMTVVTLPALDGDVKSFATELFNHWHIGKRDKDNGVLVVLAVRQRRIEVETGYGVEDRLPDAVVGRIIHERMVPSFKRGDYAGGLTSGVQALAARIGAGTPASAPQFSAGASDPPAEPALQPEVPMPRGAPDAPAYKNTGEEHSPVFVVLALFFYWIVLAGPILLALRLVDFVARPSRRAPPHLETCRSSFRRLRRGLRKGELSFVQLEQEKTWRVFHRVWRCDECKAVAIRPSGRGRMLVEKFVTIPSYVWAFFGLLGKSGGGTGTSTWTSSDEPRASWSSYTESSTTTYDSGPSGSTESSSGSFGGGSSGGGGAGDSW